MPARHKARKRALDILFEAEARGVDVLSVLADRQAAADPPVGDYAAELVHGVVLHQSAIDALISANLAKGWELSRLPAVDRGLLRLGGYELCFGTGVPPAVAISEAVALASELSTEQSPAFVNGVLAALRRPAAAASELRRPAAAASELRQSGSVVGDPAGEDTPADQLLSEVIGSVVVDHGE